MRSAQTLAEMDVNTPRITDAPARTALASADAPNAGRGPMGRSRSVLGMRVDGTSYRETAEAIATGLTMPKEERVRRARGLVRTVLASNPARWLTSQLRDLDAARGVLHQRPEEDEEPFGAINGDIRTGSEPIGSLGPEDGDATDDRI